MLEKRYSDFLGFKIKMIPRRKKLVVKSHISDKQFKKPKRQAGITGKENCFSLKREKRNQKKQDFIIQWYQVCKNYYQIATNVNLDCMKLNRAVMAIFTNRLGTNKRGRLRKNRQTTYDKGGNKIW